MIKEYKKPFIVAEIGNNHEGNFDVAKKMILEAAKCGVDAVKFQTFIPDLYVNGVDKKRIKQLKKFSLTHDQFYKLSLITKKEKLKFISTPFDIESAIFLNKIVDYFKISSGDNKYFELISKVIKFNKKTIISTGLLNLSEIRNLYNFVKKIRTTLNQISFLHCVASYPVSIKNINLKRINFIKKNFDVEAGFSDHTIGLASPILAYFSGARIIEKHFTLDNNFSKFRDHKISLNPKNMANLVKFFNDFNVMSSPLQKKISKEESKNLFSMRRSYYFNKNLKKGHIIKQNDLKYVRPFKKNAIQNLKEIVNKKIKKNVFEHDVIKKNLIL